MLEGKVCLITGCSRGIGQKIAEVFAENGAVVYANAREEGCLEKWASSQNDILKGTIIPIYFDLTNSQDIRNAIVRIKKEARVIDVLVNNAGMVTNELFGMVSLDRMRKMFDVNVFGLFELTQYVVSKMMVKQLSGSVVNIASAVAVNGCKGQVAYSASKGAVVAMTKSLAKEVAEKNVRINAVAPGMIETERIQDTVENIYKGKIPDINMGRLGKCEEVANTCLFLASDNSSYITGQILAVDGGIKY